MNDATRRLRALAERIVETAPEPRVALLAGSAGRGDADYFSDLDLLLHYDEVPSKEAYVAMREALGGTDPIVIGEGEEGYCEQFLVDGVACQVAFFATASFDNGVEKVLEEPDRPHQKVIAGRFEALVLRGDDLVDEWRRGTVYTDELRRAVIERHWRFFPLWYFDEHVAARDATIWRQELLVEAALDLVAVLAAQNRRWWSRFEFKRQSAFLDSLELAPPRLAERLDALFGRDGVGELEGLVRETRALVEQHVPGVELKLRYPPGERQRPWS
jgi:hypothetical protein